jgi:NADH-quinone oxidoreductase subunit E
MSAQIEVVLNRFPDAGRDALIPILQLVQEAEGYLSEHAVVRVGRHLRLPAAKVYGVATFYNQFRFQPLGKYHITLCRGTACHVKGSANVLETVMRTLRLDPGSTSRDRLFSLEVVACMGACGLSPVININGEFFAKVTPLHAMRLIEGLRQKEVAHGRA